MSFIIVILPTLNYEKKLWNSGYQLVAGIDEAGRGSWAGPVVAAAVIFPPTISIPEGLRDSKLLPPRRREELFEVIKSLATAYSIAEIGVPIIDRVGIGRATQYAMRRALRQLEPAAEFHLIDYYSLKYIPKSKQKPIKFGDKLCASIAAASILAKVHRDHLLVELGRQYPSYAF
ncbi:ribonuclease HII, partial [Candidatus Parcubacteria bacterium]|nr:ribonuclease HII [Candidatus Parcubacteria bacterium]